MSHRLKLALAAATLAVGCACASIASADWPNRFGDEAAWDNAFDAATGTRFIPMQLIVPGRWSGERVIEHPSANFTDPGGDRWSGPESAIDAASGRPIRFYKRERRDRSGYVAQRFAVRDQGDGLGRIYDSRFGRLVCSGEIKFPLGEWRQGETRENAYSCFSEDKHSLMRTNVITIEKIDFPCRGVPHCLQFTWTHYIEGRAEPEDNRRYVFAPGLGEITHDRR